MPFLLSVVLVAFSVGAASVLFGLAVYIVRERPSVGLVAIGMFAAAAWDFAPTAPVTSVGGIQVYPEDLLAAVLAMVAILNAPMVRKNLPNPGIIAIFAALVVISLIRGMLDHGLGTAVNEARSFIYLMTALSWCLSYPAAEMNDLVLRWLRVVGCALLGIAAMHVARSGLAGADTIVETADGLSRTGRPLVSGQTMLLAAAGIVGMRQGASLRVDGPGGMLSASFLTFVVLAQHRSVWAATFASIAVLLFLGGGPIRRRVLIGVTVSAFSATLALLAGALETVVQGLRDSLTSRSTYDARSSGWRQLLEGANQSGCLTQLFGAPFGDGYARVSESGATVNYEPHNWYLTIYLRLGALGVFAYGIGLAATLARSLRLRDAVGAALLVLVAVYSWAYTLNWYLAPVLAIVLLSIADDKPQSAHEVRAFRRRDTFARRRTA